jgi:hypothetical protein
MEAAKEEKVPFFEPGPVSGDQEPMFADSAFKAGSVKAFA